MLICLRYEKSVLARSPNPCSQSLPAVPAGIEPCGSHGQADSWLGETVPAVRDAVASATIVAPTNPIAT